MSAATCRALVCHTLSDDLSGLAFETRDSRAPGPGQVRLRTLAVAIGFPDLLMTRGGYQHKPELPFVPGMECCAEVIEAGSGVDPRFAPGTRVIGSAKEGALATERILPASALRPPPPGLSVAQAAALGSQGLTAYVSLVRRGQLQAGETLLVHGAGGGVGIAAVRLGVHLGARVIATAEGDASRFRQVLVEYSKAPQVTRDRMYLETMQQVFNNTTKVYVDSRSGGNNLLYLPFDKLLQQSGAPVPTAPPTAVPSPATDAGTAAAAASTFDSRSRDGSRSRERDTR